MPPSGSVGKLADIPAMPAPAALSGFSPSLPQILDLSQVTYPWPGDIFADTAGYLYGRLAALAVLVVPAVPAVLARRHASLPTACGLAAGMQRLPAWQHHGSRPTIPPCRRHPDLP